jgi:hypothetical protein
MNLFAFCFYCCICVWISVDSAFSRVSEEIHFGIPFLNSFFSQRPFVERACELHSPPTCIPPELPLQPELMLLQREFPVASPRTPHVQEEFCPANASTPLIQSVELRPVRTHNALIGSFFARCFSGIVCTLQTVISSKAMDCHNWRVSAVCCMRIFCRCPRWITSATLPCLQPRSFLF